MRPVDREGRRLSRSLPVIAGAVIAVAGLAFGSLTAANAQAGHPTSQPPSIEQQAARVHAEDAYTPVNGNAEMNLGVLEDQIEHYYGSASATFRGVGTVTVPSSTSNYARQMKQIVDDAEAYLGWAIGQHHGAGKPAVVFDIDDTPAQHLRLRDRRAVRLYLGEQRVLDRRRRVPGRLLHAAARQLRGWPRLLGVLHHRPAAVPDRGHDQRT